MADSERFLVTLAQINPTVGDIAGNAAKARDARARAAADGAALVVFPELFLCGYPPEDIVLKPSFQTRCRSVVEELARDTSDGGPAMLIGTPWVEEGELYNAVALLDGGRVAGLRFKDNLPNYGEFDEKRIFARSPAAGPLTIRGVRVGVPICEDTWMEESAEYENVVECLAETGAEILIVPNGSPYAHAKNDIRLSMAVSRVTESGLPFVYVNQVGGQDELVFDGASFALNADRTLAAQLPCFEEAVTTLTWTKSAKGWISKGPIAPLLDGDRADYAACVLGLRDYVGKNGFPGVLLGISGGIDSALCLAIAVDAIGVERARVRHPLRRAADCRCGEWLRGHPEGRLQGQAARRDRREPSGAHPRRAFDGNLEQVRRHAGDDRQQVGNVRRLRDALRRHERRLQSDQGHLQNRGVPPVVAAQFVEAGRRARPLRQGHSGQHHRASADGGVAREPDRSGLAAALRYSRRHSCAAR